MHGGIAFEPGDNFTNNDINEIIGKMISIEEDKENPKDWFENQEFYRHILVAQSNDKTCIVKFSVFNAGEELSDNIREEKLYLGSGTVRVSGVSYNIFGVYYSELDNTPPPITHCALCG